MSDQKQASWWGILKHILSAAVFHAQLYTPTSIGSDEVGTTIYPNLDLNLGRLLKSIAIYQH
jgi:hypothetical protein